MNDLIKLSKLGEYGDRLEELSEQEVFDISVGHLIAQGKQSVWGNSNCLYKGEGVCCAAAPFIKDYKEEFDVEGGKSWEGLVESYGQSAKHRILITNLQSLHDRGANWGAEGFKGYPEAKDLARRFKLDYKFEEVL